MSLGPEGMLPRGRSAGGLLFWAFQAASGSASVGGAVHCEALRLARCRWMATPHLPIRAAAAGGGARPQQPATGTAPVRAGSTGRTRHASGRGDVPVLGSAARRRRQGRLGGTGRLARAPTEGAEPRRHSSRPVPYAAPAPTPGGTSWPPGSTPRPQLVLPRPWQPKTSPPSKTVTVTVTVTGHQSPSPAPRSRGHRSGEVTTRPSATLKGRLTSGRIPAAKIPRQWRAKSPGTTPCRALRLPCHADGGR